MEQIIRLAGEGEGRAGARDEGEGEGIFAGDAFGRFFGFASGVESI